MNMRSVLSVPAGNERMIRKALDSAADVVMLDLEDATAPDRKATARRVAAEAIVHENWRGRPRTFRCNGPDTPWMYRDVIEILQQTEALVDRIVVPKVRRASDVTAVGLLLDQIEIEFGRTSRIELDVQIETAGGLIACEAISISEARVVALTFGPGDFAASAGYPLAGIGLEDEWDRVYGAHRWHYPMSRIAIAAHAAGISAIDGPYAAFRDLEGLRRSALHARALGFDGKWCIHPDQIAVVAEIFTPSQAEIERARAIVDAYTAAQATGVGAIAIDGEMIDAANIRMARRTLASAGEIEAIDASSG